ncbi:MAG: DUF4281 domain-containing protein [Acidobacteria bacterium]|nr:DUF4281 domain-containing protein [Acidobacteriota bacterium]
MNAFFELGTYLVMPFWLLAIVAPTWHGTRRAMASPLIGVGPALIYAVLLLPSAVDVLPIVARPDLPSVMLLLGTPTGATIAWQHFLAFDLLVARWIYGDAVDVGLNPWVLRLVLALTLLIGPVGFLAHLLARRTGRGWQVAGNQAT